MNKNKKKLIIQRYQDRFRKYGASINALASGSYDRQKIRFNTLKEVGIANGDKILDIGCGFADFYEYLIASGFQIDYTGIDIVPELVESAKEKFPHLRIETRDIELSPIPNASFDYVVCSQVFNYNFKDESNLNMAIKMMQIMFKIARKGVAIDFISNYVDFKEDHLFYFSPEVLFSEAKKVTKSVTLRHDMQLYEFCIYLYPDFKKWK